MFAFKAVRALASRSAHAVQRTAVQHFGHAQVRAMSARPRLELTEAEADPEIALTNLLYNHPTEEAEVDVEGQIVSLLVEDEPGVLSRTSSLLSGRGYNIKSLSVSPTNVAGLSRMTITVLASSSAMGQVVKQLNGIEEVLAVLRSNRADSVHREVLLMKMSTEPPAAAAALHTTEAERLLYIHDKRASLMDLANLFKAEIVDVGIGHVTIELTAWPKRIEAVIELARPYGILEVARSGAIVMPRGQVVQPEGEAPDEVVNLAHLPPS